MGDINCDILKSPPDAHTRKLLFLSSLYQYYQLIDSPARVTRTSAIAIGLIFTNRAENILKSGTSHLGISDHNLIFAIRKFPIHIKSQNNVRFIRNFKWFNSNEFVTGLTLVPWDIVTQYDNPNECWQTFPSGP